MPLCGDGWAERRPMRSGGACGALAYIRKPILVVIRRQALLALPCRRDAFLRATASPGTTA